VPETENPEIAEALPAASVLLIRDGASGLEVLMTERAKTMAFAPGALVFPGGKVDAQDCDKALWQGLTNAEREYDDFALRIAVLRELYEEAAVLLTQQVVPSKPQTIDFRERLLKEKVVLNLADLVPFAHWVTPEPMPRRFDTHFYLVPHNGQTAIHDGNEAISLKWVNPETTLLEWETDQVPLMFPTRLNLIKLARAKTVSEAITQAKNTKIVRTLPTMFKDKDGMNVRIDETSGYGVTVASEKELRLERHK